MINRSQVLRVLTVIVLLAFPAAMLAQTGANGVIVGTVTDTSGGAMPNVKVTITNAATNLSRETVTSSLGTYSMPLLRPGFYKVEARKPGFTSALVTGVRVDVGKEVETDVVLKPGVVTQTVSVTASVVELDTQNAAVGNMVGTTEVEDLPLNGRNFTELVTLGAGATTNSAEQGDYRVDEGNGITIQGSRPDDTQYTLDGIYINDFYYQTPSIIPNLDAIQEFQEQTKDYSAASGGGANVVNITTKSGTNLLHGTAYDFLRNSALDSREFFNTSIPPLRQNQFGYTLGGPVYIPKVYDGRNRSFFFAEYEGLRERSNGTGISVVPTTAELAGDFPSTITNPATGSPFPNNTIPQSDFSTFGRLARNHFPAPNISLPSGNYYNSYPEPQNNNQQMYRFDQQIDPSNT